MLLHSIQKLAEPIGFDIGNSNNEAQANLLNGFFDGLFSIRHRHDLVMQMVYIEKELHEETKKRIIEFAEFLSAKKD